MKICVQTIWEDVREGEHEVAKLEMASLLYQIFFMKLYETLNCHNFLITWPILMKLSLLDLLNFTIFDQINLYTVWSCPLTY